MYLLLVVFLCATNTTQSDSLTPISTRLASLVASFKDLHKKLPGNTLSSKCWAYVIGHMTCSGTTFLCSQYFYSSFMLHTAWITGLLLYSAWLGSKYYSYTYGGDRVAKRLEERLAETEKAK